MLYREFVPSPPLRPYVECFWIARSEARRSPGPREILLPDGTTQLLLSFGGAYERFEDPVVGRGARVAGSHIVGMRTRGVFIEQEGGEDVFAVRFRAGGLFSLLRLPMVEVVHRSVPLDDVLGAFADELEARVFEAFTSEERVRVAEHALLTQLQPGGKGTGSEERVRQAVQRIYIARGALPIDRLARELGLGYRSLDRAFNLHVGIPPKRLSRIVRFNYALSLLQRGGGLSHSRVAQEAKYADQAHMIRDFREFTHTAPTEFLARSYGIVEASRPALRKRLSNSFNPER